MTRRQFGIPGAVLVMGFALSGCATVAAPEAGFSDAEWGEFVHSQSDISWEALGLDPELRPPDPPIETVSPDQYQAKYAGCMNDAGFDKYLADGTIVVTEDQTDAELIASFDCSMRISVDPEGSGLLNRAQRDYAYDYFEQVLVPCLAKHDITTVGAPTRDAFHELFGLWNPYSSMRQKDQDRVFGDAQLRVDCPTAPPGLSWYYG